MRAEAEAMSRSTEIAPSGRRPAWVSCSGMSVDHDVKSVGAIDLVCPGRHTFAAADEYRDAFRDRVVKHLGGSRHSHHDAVAFT